MPQEFFSFLSSLGTYLYSTWVFLYFVIEAIGILLAVHAIMHSRTPQSAFAWGIALVMLPIFGILGYLVFGQNRFWGYTLAGNGNSPLDRAKQRIWSLMERHRCVFREEFQDLTRLCERVTGLPATTGNSTRLLIDGKETFAAIFDAVKNAKEFVIVQFYIVNDDEIGKEFQEILLGARSRGVKVFFLYDAVGSKLMTDSYRERLAAAGVQIFPFVTNRKIGVRFQINFRNHRKLVLVDGNEAFTGGLNIGDEYLGKSKRFGPWRDTHIHLKGPAVLPLLAGFFEDWHYIAGELPEIPIVQPEPTGENKQVFSFGSGPADEIEICPVIYTGAIREAKERIWIASPYMVPDAATRQALQHAALRGIDVRILLPGMADHKLPWYSSFAYYPLLRQAGIRVFRMKHGFMHQKILLVDNDLSMVGTINFDYRSFFLNFEQGVVTCDEQFGKEVQAMLEKDLAQSVEEDLCRYEKSPFFFRFLVRFAALFSPEQ